MNYKTKKILKSIGFILLGVTLCLTFLSFGGFINEDTFAKERNDKNLIALDDTYLESGKSDKGIEWKVSDDGSIKIYGEASSADSIVVKNIALEAGTYTYSVGNSKVNIDKFYSCVVANGEEYIAGTDSATFELTEGTTVQVIISWTEDADFGSVIGTTFRPVLVTGKTAGNFYAE